MREPNISVVSGHRLRPNVIGCPACGAEYDAIGALEDAIHILFKVAPHPCFTCFGVVVGCDCGLSGRLRLEFTGDHHVGVARP